MSEATSAQELLRRRRGTAFTSGRSRALRGFALGAWPVLFALVLAPLTALLAPADPSEPLARAAAIARAEAWLGLNFEPAAAAWLDGLPALDRAVELFYFWVHLPATVGVLVWAWLERRPAFPVARDAFVFTQLLTVVGNALVPTAPPWMGAEAAARAAEGDAVVYLLQSPFAAVPSGHVAFAAFTAGTVLALVRRRAICALAVAYAALVLVVVIATANHFWLDAVAGVAVAAAGALLSRRVHA